MGNENDLIMRADAIEFINSGITLDTDADRGYATEMLKNIPPADAVSRESYIKAVGYVKWLEKLIVDSETFEWLCEDTNDNEWCEKNCNYSSIQAECLRHLYEAEQVTGKLKNPCDSLFKDDSDTCKKSKSKLMSVPIQPVELKKPFNVDEIPQNYEPRILGNVEVVVRCRNCKHYRAEYGSCTAEHWDLSRVTFPHVEPNDYCSYGERKGGGTK